MYGTRGAPPSCDVTMAKRKMVSGLEGLKRGMDEDPDCERSQDRDTDLDVGTAGPTIGLQSVLALRPDVIDVGEGTGVGLGWRW
jgi:hypothetical protein